MTHAMHIFVSSTMGKWLVFFIHTNKLPVNSYWKNWSQSTTINLCLNHEQSNMLVFLTNTITTSASYEPSERTGTWHRAHLCVLNIFNMGIHCFLHPYNVSAVKRFHKKSSSHILNCVLTNWKVVVFLTHTKSSRTSIRIKHVMLSCVLNTGM